MPAGPVSIGFFFGKRRNQADDVVDTNPNITGIRISFKFQLKFRCEKPGHSIVIARAAGPKQSHGDKKGLLRGVYPERSRRARKDTGENLKTSGKIDCSVRGQNHGARG